LISHPLLGAAVRAIVALALVVACVLIWTILFRREGWKDSAAMIGVGLAMLTLAPATYVAARTRHDLGKLGEYLQQSRFGEAQTLVQRLLVLDAHAQWNGQPLNKAALGIEQVVAQLERQVASSPGAHATSEGRLEQARALAMLGRSEAALAVLDSLNDRAAAAEIGTLRGTIQENRGQWEAALTAYTEARAAWEARPASEDRADGLLRAVTGIAYCQRKAGRYAAADATYQQVLALAPTADSHFLLAQFYEDAQQADKARVHARQAMLLDPRRYQQQGSKLINKLAVYHFGCLGVFRAESGQAGQP
jgi:tetratricopeptide (TPR) repeat protein